ncbi:MAG: TIGR04282 family arsenosugar biosynthesis glycosyltransferase, partial [Hyphomicrobiaceae bacterium]|nr:TIGR04282 family arsenosugar biosynthesis glycosyltransferase [Hyphomicrobiaceae bacterium]
LAPSPANSSVCQYANRTGPMTAAIAIICKTPRAGFSKTRMIPLLGPQAAAALAGAFLRDICDVVVETGAGFPLQGYAVYAPAGSEAALAGYLPRDFRLLCQEGGDLGRVLLSSSEHLLREGHSSVLLVNADSPTLPAGRLAMALDALGPAGDRVVLGPALDGGYYLIGLKRPHAHLFADIPWSTSDVLARTRERARELALPVVELPAWYDVDDAATLGLLTAELAGTPPACALPGDPPPSAAATRAVIARLAVVADASA